MIKKKIAFVSPVGNGGPTELYRQLVPLLNKKFGDTFECTLFDTTTEWLRLHWNPEKYDAIISVLPFLWKPHHCEFILNIHGDYRLDQSFRNPGSLLAYLYPRSVAFADKIIFPSEYLKKSLGLKHPKQDVIGNFCSFPLQKEPKTYEDGKKNFNWITTTNWNNPHKAEAILELMKTVCGGDYIDREIEWNIIGGGREKYQDKIHDIVKQKPNIHVHCLGQKENSDILDLLDKSDIFLYATFAESFGIAILEAANRGLPLVLEHHAAFDELWNADSIFAARNISGELIKLMNSTAYYQKRSEEGIEDAEKFSTKNIIGGWNHILET